MKIIGFFCEDIRPETGGTETIVGVLPDNISVPQVPGIIPKLAIYLRVQMDMDEPPQSLVALLKLPWGETITLGEAEKTILETAVKQAKENNLPFAGIIMRGVLSSLPVKAYGLVTVVAVVDGKERVCAMLNIKPPAAAAATALPDAPSQIAR